MVEYMRSTVLFALIFVNAILSSLNIFFSIKGVGYKPLYKNNSNYNYRYLSSINESLLEKNKNYFNKDFLSKEIESPKKIRNLGSINFMGIILYINACSFFLIILLIMSFWITKNECCNNDEDIIAAFPEGSCNGKCLCCGECKWKYFDDCCPNNSACSALSYFIRIFMLVPLSPFIIIYLIVNACGKHVCRMICVIFLMLLNLASIILSFISGTDTFCILVAVCSFIAFVCNLLSIILPNCIERLSYYEYEPVWNDDQYYQDEYLEDAIYPGSEEVEQDLINKPVTPENVEQNPGYDNDDINNRNSINSLDAATPISNKTSGDNNQENHEMKNLENDQENTLENNQENTLENDQENNQENIPYPSDE